MYIKLCSTNIFLNSRTMRTYLCGSLVILATCSAVIQALAIKLKADVIYVQNGNTTSALFRCSAGQGHMFYLNHIITWSKKGRDGREKYLSLNWDLVQQETQSQYVISSQVYNEGPKNSSKSSPEMYFVLGKPSLTPDDHGEYICRLHDFDRNVIAEHSVPIIVFDKGLALSPYKIEGEAGVDIAINCMQNTSVSNGSHIVLHHVTKDGVSTKIVDDGIIVNDVLKKKYDFMTRDNGDRILHNILTLKASSLSDHGNIVCEMRNASGLITETNATITIAEPKLKVSPLYFLKVPEDATAHFKCECPILDTAACINNDMVWSMVNASTGIKTAIYKGGKLLDNSGIYEITVSQNGSAVNLTIHGLKTRFYEGGEYVCSLEDKSTGDEITYASIPVSITPISLGALALLDNYPASIRLLCTMTGSMWDNHYFDDHKMSWVHVKDGVSKIIASNGALEKGYDPSKVSMMFDNQRYYSILSIKSVKKNDYGDYNCQLTNNHSGAILLTEKLKIYGKGNITLFSSMNA
ncbi:uncharacterized protein LOC123532443 [Mercenaria mercenaria]|uniref:uncharacterized protein LOC123532443 n=1 Tax=Mercenaria mercenaria TaxID=6596 RepID=UPI00234EA8BC|nr:uncharacterized protein LOC123532443 [Mercenaria mercenaria]